MQDPKSTKYIKFLCAEDSAFLERWMVGMRIAKHGRQLMENYRLLIDELDQEDLDKMAHAPSCSVHHLKNQFEASTPTQGIYQAPSDISGRHYRASSSSSIRCMC